MTPPPGPTEVQLEEVARLPDEIARKEFLERYPDFICLGTVVEITQAVFRRIRVDVPQALGLAEGALAVARKLGDTSSLAHALWAKGAALFYSGQNEPALELLEHAGGLFEKTGEATELGRTLYASIQPLIFLGEYDRALAVAERAREIFTREGDERRLGRLDINVGNIFHRLDRFREALEFYERAIRRLEPLRDADATAFALSNVAMTRISLDDFPGALEAYRRARSLCERNGMPVLVAQADYNIAYLYFLRGEYGRAIDMLRATREACRQSGDAYHAALCHLDLAEIYLELNLNGEAVELARDALGSFRQIGMRYEAAKALAFLAIGLCREGRRSQGLETFLQASTAFEREGNAVWPRVIDLYRALILEEEGRFSEGRGLCAAALEFFRSSRLPRKVILSRLLLARFSLRIGDLAEARRECTRALSVLEEVAAPALLFQASFLMGQIEEADGEAPKAYASYQNARTALETLRTSLQGDELKIAFVKNKLKVYERLVDLCLNHGSGPASAEEAFAYIERAKSRVLAELVFRHAHALSSDGGERAAVPRRVQELREELNWCYRRAEMAELGSDGHSPELVERLEAKASSLEEELLRLRRELPASEAGEEASAICSLHEIRASLPLDATLIEYFRVGERFIVCLLEREALEIRAVAPVARVQELLALLRFQLSKFHLGPEYLESFREPLVEATRSHLRELYRELLAPIRPLLRGRQIVIAPHDVLHSVPFHALWDGEGYLIDSFTVSYAPSASVFCLCQRRARNASERALILGVPDERAPLILEEVASVADVLTGAELLVGADASEQALRDKGPSSGILHIATHGNFRGDNPMFSRVRLGGSYLSLYDLYRLKLPVELVTLSGCGTGLNVVASGDEILGLVRGFLQAGAQSLLVALWDVHDRSTVELMKAFYGCLRGGVSKTEALQRAMLDLRERSPHPYFWAPFILVGQPGTASLSGPGEESELR